MNPSRFARLVFGGGGGTEHPKTFRNMPPQELSDLPQIFDVCLFRVLSPPLIHPTPIARRSHLIEAGHTLNTVMSKRTPLKAEHIFLGKRAQIGHFQPSQGFRCL